MTMTRTQKDLSVRQPSTDSKISIIVDPEQDEDGNMSD